MNSEIQELENFITPRSSRLAVLRWFARMWAVMVVAFVGAFLLIHLLGAVGGSTFRGNTLELIRFLCFPAGLVVGLLLGWRSEFWGGLLSIGSIAGYHLVNVVAMSDVPFDWLITSFAFPGILYLLSAALHRSETNDS